MSVVDLFSPEPDSQVEAADPTISAFVTANAGAGKTKTLIDRVARLLLLKAKPETILCVTYTKAAASEMQRRLFEVLGDWSVATDAKLRQELGKLRSRDPASFERQELSDARSLFAAALETPGGLKIQTIHAFCEKVLKRFPIEAGVPPGFRVLDEPAQAAVAAAARRLVAHHVLNVPGDLADAYGRLSVALDFRRFQAMFGEFEAQRRPLSQFLAGDLERAIGWIWQAVDIPEGTEPADLAIAAMAAMDRGLYRRAAEALKPGGKTDAQRAEALAALAEADPADFEAAQRLFFTKDGDDAKWIGSARRLKDIPELQTAMLGEQSRLALVRERMRAARVGRDSTDAVRLANAYLEAYEIEKRAAGGLDFEDLVERTCGLLRDRPAAAWVLFKLDGGIDHILLDEAQDTAPEQWKIVDALTEEFFAGEGRRTAERLKRALFVVGDEKQSIYSFQGARPELLRTQYEFHRDRASGAGYRLKQLKLVESWRSTPQVLSFVDAVFAPTHLRDAIQPGQTVEHATAPPRREHAGCVDVWDMEVDRKGPDRDAWDLPLDVEPEDSANRRLAKRIAAEVDSLIRRRDGVYDKQTGKLRAAHAGDVLILVRRRGALFEEILRALKRIDLPVAGADRLSLTSHIVFDDLLALARFALFPSDELTLAALLKSPFCDIDDDGLYRLAHGREGSLWTVLRRRAGEEPLWGAAAGFLQAVIEAGRACRPFEFFVRLTELVGPDARSMRQRLLRRLGAEAKDALDEFLNQALAAEARGAHDLETLADELADLEIVVKREMDADRGEVRVMTAHGAKGLEAPIVILPELLPLKPQQKPLMRVIHSQREGFLWCGRSGDDCPITAQARAERTAREEAESYRLLYVALTRARDRLILCGRRSERTKEENIKGWWRAVRDTLNADGVAEQVRELADTTGRTFWRFGPDPAPVATRGSAKPLAAPLPDWTRAPAAPEAEGRFASPSHLGEDAARAPALSPLTAIAGGLGRFRRGDLIHRLLQILPDLPPEHWDEGARALLAREGDLTAEQAAEMAQAALSVLRDARFAEVFGPGSRAEVAIAGTAAALPPGLSVSGRIDRLVVLGDRVLVADFKTNRPSPGAIEDADPAYVRQMAVYAAVLAEVFPGRRIEAALVWTDGPKLMPIPENLLAASLAELGRTG
jgi:ATP-dependent helicase/nuclease subunit A